MRSAMAYKLLFLLRIVNILAKVLLQGQGALDPRHVPFNTVSLSGYCLAARQLHANYTPIFNNFIHEMFVLYSSLHPRVLFRQAGFSMDRPEVISFPFFPNIEVSITSEFDHLGQPRLACLDNRLHCESSCVHKRLMRRLAVFSRKLRTIIRAFPKGFSTPGMLTISEALFSLHMDAKSSYEWKSLQSVVSCSIAVDTLTGAGIRFQKRMNIAAAMLYSALLHHHFSPVQNMTNALLSVVDIPTIQHCFFHHRLGSEHRDILASLLTLISETANPPTRNLQAAEIGVSSGHTSAYLLDNVRNLWLLSVDPYFEALPKNQELLTWPNVYNKTVYEEVKLLLLRYGSHSALWRMTSREAAPLVNSTLDLVFLDGDHSYEAVREDIELWQCKLRAGGVLAGHDYNMPSVRKAVHEHVMATDSVLHLGPDFVWWLYVVQ